MSGGSRISFGIRQMALGAFYFSLMGLLVRMVGQRIPNQEVVLVRGLLTLVFTWFLLRRAGVDPWGNRKRGLVMRGFLGFAALSCFYYSLVHLPLAEATLLQYMNPLWAAVLAAGLLQERMTRREIGLVLASLCGVVLVARPEFLFGGASPGYDPLAVVVGVTGGALAGAAYVGVRELSRTEHPLVIVFYFPLVTIPAALPGALAALVWPTPLEWLLLLGVGITAQLGQIHITRGLREERAGRATAVGYLQVVFAGILGVVFLGELPGAWALAGSAVILGATLLLSLERERVLPPPPPAAAR